VNYRHSFHAGNIADVFKHAVLCRVLEALARKDTPFAVLDSHAGAGAYRLKAPGEFEQGIGQLWPEREHWPALERYFTLIERINGPGPLRDYPGSPLFIAESLRAQDSAVLFERQHEECRALRSALRGRKRIRIGAEDGWSGIKGFVPPPENRGLVFVDPPYERADDFARIAPALAQALKRWRNGIYLVWYPIKTRAPVEALHAALATCGAPGYAVEFLTLPTDVEQRLNGSGLALLNPPWQLRETLAVMLPPLATRLAGRDGRPQLRFRDYPG
jgi:23S rRNA (adenine2030-N6)-methyltransferase